jgi:flagellar hook-basal body complex protein FliE
LREGEFLARLYDLTKLPSRDSRFADAAGDIAQHRDSWKDWPDDWVFSDTRFGLLHATDEEYLRFLCETLHPVVRRNADQARELAAVFNEALRQDGWKLSEQSQVSGHPMYQAVRLDGRIEIFDEPTGWEKVDRQLQEAKRQLETAQSEENFQAVGLICREVLISVAQAAFDATRHQLIDDVDPSKTDARRMLEAFFETELRGGPNEAVRAHAKAALNLAVALQHRRTADFRMAALCCEATTSVVSISAIVSGKRG